MDLVRTVVPDGLRPRLLNMLSVLAVTEKGNDWFRPYMNTAKHFELSVDASQYMALEVRDDFNGLMFKEQTDAPHPFDNYTVSFWLGLGDAMLEIVLVVVRDKGAEQPTVGMVNIRSDQDVFIGMDGTPRIDTFEWDIEGPDILNPNLPPALRDKAILWQKTAWGFLNIFRNLINSKQGVTLSHGRDRRVSLTKGKRVVYQPTSAVTIDLDAVRRLSSGPSEPTGRTIGQHPCRAHDCYKGVDPLCAHRWEPAPNSTPENRRETCTECGGRRWSRRA